MPFKVIIMESEAGWGQKVDDIEYYQTAENALKRVDEINSKNNKSEVPSIYWYAHEPEVVRSIPQNKKFKD